MTKSFWNPAVFAEAATVGDELDCPTGVFFIEVRPHHSAPPSVALAQGCGMN